MSTTSTADTPDCSSSPRSLIASELVIAILEHLAARDLAHCISVCKEWKRMIETTSCLQYIMKLAQAYMEDGTLAYPTHSSSSRLQRLDDYQKAWKSFKFTESTDFDMEQENHDDTWEALCDVVAKCTSSGSKSAVTMIRIPSRIRGIEKKEWTLEFPFAIRDFTIDPAQDLLLVIDEGWIYQGILRAETHKIHILSMTTGEKHPLAEQETINRGMFPDTMIGMETHFDFRVYDNLLGVAGGATEVWDWRTGTSMRPAGDGHNVDPIDSFAFIDKKYLLIARGDSPVLEVVQIETWETVLRIFVPSSAPDMNEYTGSIIIHPDCSNCSASSLFTHKHADRLFVVSCENPEDDTFPACTMFFKRSALMDLITKRDAIDFSDETSIDITNTMNKGEVEFVLSESLGLSQVWTCVVHGLKVIVKEEDEDQFTIRDYSRTPPEVTHYTWTAPQALQEMGQSSILGGMLLADGLVVVTGDDSGDAFGFNILSL